MLSLYAEAPALAAAHPVDAAFFPLKGGVIEAPAPQTMAFTKDEAEAEADACRQGPH